MTPNRVKENMRAIRPILLIILLTGCAGSRGKAFEDMTAAEHRQAAAIERRKAWDRAEEAREELYDSDEGFWGGTAEEWDSPYAYEFFDASWDPMEPEYYVIDPRTRVAGEDDADAARRHREKAEWHESAAKQLDEMARERRATDVARAPGSGATRVE